MSFYENYERNYFCHFRQTHFFIDQITKPQCHDKQGMKMKKEFCFHFNGFFNVWMKVTCYAVACPSNLFLCSLHLLLITDQSFEKPKWIWAFFILSDFVTDHFAELSNHRTKNLLLASPNIIIHINVCYCYCFFLIFLVSCFYLLALRSFGLDCRVVIILRFFPLLHCLFISCAFVVGFYSFSLSCFCFRNEFFLSFLSVFTSHLKEKTEQESDDLIFISFRLLLYVCMAAHVRFLFKTMLLTMEPLSYKYIILICCCFFFGSNIKCLIWMEFRLQCASFYVLYFRLYVVHYT